MKTLLLAVTSLAIALVLNAMAEAGDLSPEQRAEADCLYGKMVGYGSGIKEGRCEFSFDLPSTNAIRCDLQARAGFKSDVDREVCLEYYAAQLDKAQAAGTLIRVSDATERARLRERTGGPSPHGRMPPYPEMNPLQHEALRPFHDVIASWKDKDGMPCCNEQDCRIVDDYVVDLDQATGEEAYSVRIFDRWWSVPSAALRPYTSVTYGVIAC